jgi:hypothetical protein
MSAMLEQAIIDASALKEAAVKSAEQAIVEKYAPEVRQAVEALLEQGPPPMDPTMMGMDPAMMGADPMAMQADPMAMGAPPPPPGAGGDPASMAMGALSPPPMAATEGENLCPCPDEQQVVTVNFPELMQATQNEAAMQDAMMAQAAGPGMPPAAMSPAMGGMGMGAGMPIPPAAMQSPLAMGGGMDMPQQIAENQIMKLTQEALQEIVDSEEFDINESVLDELVEEIRANFSSPSTGMGGNTTPVGVHQEGDDIVAAEVAVHNSNKDSEESEEDGKVNENLRKQTKELTDYAFRLQEQNKEMHAMLLHINEKLYNVNLSNAKLFYTNRVLSNNSLNERQRTKIVETISKCGSPEEAKALFETLLSTVGTQAKPVKTPKSLSEAVTRDRSIQMPRRQKQNSSPDAKALSRMKLLAGIKK